MAVKKNIEDVQGKDNYPCGQQLLIHNGKVLKDETTLAENKVTEDGFLVVMLSKVTIFFSLFYVCRLHLCVCIMNLICFLLLFYLFLFVYEYLVTQFKFTFFSACFRYVAMIELSGKMKSFNNQQDSKLLYWK